MTRITLSNTYSMTELLKRRGQYRLKKGATDLADTYFQSKFVCVKISVTDSYQIYLSIDIDEMWTATRLTHNHFLLITNYYCKR